MTESGGKTSAFGQNFGRDDRVRTCGIDGVKAIVTLDPPEATIEFTDKEFSLNELQQVIQNKAGDYKLHDLE